METIGLQTLIQIFRDFGPFGIVVILWWYDGKQTRKILSQYKDDMDEARQMYKNNVHLLERNEELSGDLKDVIIMNTKAMTTLAEKIEGNDFCPMVRLKKQAPGVVEG